MRLIDADEFIATHGMPLTMSQFYGNTAELKSFNEGIRFVVGCMKGFPVHDPVKHGHWKEKRKYEVGAAVDDDGWLELEELCSVCGKWVKTQWRSPLYCPDCGAKMDEVSE